jgi:hypothetical protein
MPTHTSSHGVKITEWEASYFIWGKQEGQSWEGRDRIRVGGGDLRAAVKSDVAQLSRQRRSIVWEKDRRATTYQRRWWPACSTAADVDGPTPAERELLWSDFVKAYEAIPNKRGKKNIRLVAVVSQSASSVANFPWSPHSAWLVCYKQKTRDELDCFFFTYCVPSASIEYWSRKRSIKSWCA